VSEERYGFIVVTSNRKPGEDTVTLDYRSAIIRPKDQPLESMDEYAREFLISMYALRPLADLFTVDPDELHRVPADKFDSDPASLAVFSATVNHAESGKQFSVILVVSSDLYDVPRIMFLSGRDVGRFETLAIASAEREVDP